MQPPPRLYREHSPRSLEIHLVSIARRLGLVQQFDLRREVRQTVRGLPYSCGHRAAYCPVSPVHPHLPISFVQHQLDRPAICAGRPAPQAVNLSPRKAAGAETRETPVLCFEDLPRRDRLPHARDVHSQNPDVEIGMLTGGGPAEQIDRPASGNPPRRAGRLEQAGDLLRVPLSPESSVSRIAFHRVTFY